MKILAIAAMFGLAFLANKCSGNTVTGETPAIVHTAN